MTSAGRAPFSALAFVFGLGFFGLGLACGPTPREPAAEPSTPAGLDLASLDLGGADPLSWVRIHDPEKSWDGVNLDLFRRRIPVLFDSSGRILHAWPRARAQERARLLPDGRLLAIGLGLTVFELDWNGEPVWEARLEKRIPHHDILRLANGNRLVITRLGGSGWDSLTELDEAGRIAWEWNALEHLLELRPGAAKARDVTHFNSVDELPENPWFAAGDRRFRPGNLLVSARNLDRIFVIDRQTGEVVWSFTEQLDHQHEARMIPPGLPSAGEILLFSNGSRDLYRYRQSVLMQLEPRTGKIGWTYETPGFFARVGGVVQALPNDNVLVTTSRGNRAFELTRAGDVVWQWVTPFPPVRVHRYPWDHCPQLAGLSRSSPRAVVPPAGYRHVDAHSYRFAPRPRRRREVPVDGEMISALAASHECRRLFLPAAADLTATFGLDRAALKTAGRRAYAARFAITVRPDGAAEATEILATTLGPHDPAQETQTISLAAHAHRWVELCIAADEVGAPSGTPSEPFAYWLEPILMSPEDRLVATSPAGEDDVTGLTEEEKQTRREHLKALGYVE